MLTDWKLPLSSLKDKADKDSWKTIRVYPDYRRVGAIILKADANDIKIKDFTIFYEGGFVERIPNFTGELDEGRSIHHIMPGGRFISEIIYNIKSPNWIGRRGKLELSVRYMQY